MFGYVIPFKPELRIKEYNVFRAYYCSICKSIKNNFGNLERAALNYDMTFLAIFIDGLTEDKCNASLENCIAHPFKKRPILKENNSIYYAASMNVALTYYKILDDACDDKDLKSKFLLKILSPYNKKFNDKTKYINNIIKENLLKLSNMENTKNFNSIDEICDYFSIIVGKIFELYPYNLYNDTIDKRELLYNFGYTLGKWIYLVDALDDLKEDMKRNKFNPINYLYNKDNLPYKEFKESIIERIEFNILSCASNCNDILNKLEFKKNKAIIQNIVSLGMMDKYLKVKNEINHKKKGSNFNESI